MADPRHLLGKQGEEMAAAWLSARGWAILARRWRCPAGELDLIARDPYGVIVGIEVKLRRGRGTGGAVESIDRRRLRRLRAALGQFLGTWHDAAGSVRIDLVAVSRAPDGRWHLVQHAAIDAW